MKRRSNCRSCRPARWCRNTPPPPPAAPHPTSLSLDLIYTPAFAASGQLEDMTDLAKSLPYFEHLSKAHVGTGTYKAASTALPMSADASVLIWNKKLFKQAGLDPEKGPTNWAEIEALCRKGQRAWRRHQRLLLLRHLRRLQRLHLHAADLGVGRRYPRRGRLEGARSTARSCAAPSIFTARWSRRIYVPAGAQTDTGTNFFGGFAAGNIGISPSGAFAIGTCTTSTRTSTSASPSCRARMAAGHPLPAATISSSPRAATNLRR